MPDFSFNLTDPLDILGVVGILIGGLLILGGLGILKLDKVYIREGRTTWITGIAVAVLGAACLWLNGRVPVPLTVGSARGVPVILGIHSHDSATTAGLLDADIQFRDDDGDAELVTYELISTTARNVHITDDPFSIPADEQKVGTVVTIHWNCLGGGYVVKLNAIVVDQAGHRSARVPFVLDCA